MSAFGFAVGSFIWFLVCGAWHEAKSNNPRALHYYTVSQVWLAAALLLWRLQ
jgi:hypothetical protein